MAEEVVDHEVEDHLVQKVQERLAADHRIIVAEAITTWGNHSNNREKKFSSSKNLSFSSNLVVRVAVSRAMP